MAFEDRPDVADDESRLWETDGTDWASNPTGGDAPATGGSWTDGIIEAGGVNGQPWSSAKLNRVTRTSSEWIQYLTNDKLEIEDTGDGYDALYNFIVHAPAGAVALLTDDSWDDQPGTATTVAALGAGVARCTAVCTDGQFLWTADEDGIVRMHARGDLSILSTYTHDAEIFSLHCDGGKVVLGSATGASAKEVVCLTFLTSTPWTMTAAWTYAHGATVYGVFTDSARVYYGGIVNGSTKTHGALNYGSGASVWTGDHGATVYALFSTGVLLHLGGQRGTGNFTYRCFSSPLAGTEITARRYDTGAGTIIQTIAALGDHVWLGLTAATGGQLRRLRFADTAMVEAVNVEHGSAVTTLSYDGRGLLVGSGNTTDSVNIKYYDPWTLSQLWSYDAAATVWGVVSDGIYGWAGQTDGGAAENVIKIKLGAGARIYRKTSATNAWRRPFFMLAVPQDLP